MPVEIRNYPKYTINPVKETMLVWVPWGWFSISLVKEPMLVWIYSLKALRENHALDIKVACKPPCDGYTKNPAKEHDPAIPPNYRE
jgi:hypothetical protein